MNPLKLALPFSGILSLAACIDGGGSSPAVTSAATPAASCAYLKGLPAEHIAKIGTTRCGPQRELPYTYAN